MIIVTVFFKRMMVLFFFAITLSGCSNREIRDLQSSVNQLNSRVQNYQQANVNDTAETASSLGQMNQEMKNAFRDIRYTQSNLETSVESMTKRLSNLEAEVESLKSRLNRLDNLSSSSAQETLALKESQQSSLKQVNDILQNLQHDLANLQQDNTNLRNNVSRIDASQKSLSNRVDANQSNNQEVYRKILKELGAGDNTSPTKNGQSYSGTIYAVQSGDTLSKIAVKYGVDIKELQRVNGIDDPSKIQLGQKIRIP